MEPRARIAFLRTGEGRGIVSLLAMLSLAASWWLDLGPPTNAVVGALLSLLGVLGVAAVLGSLERPKAEVGLDEGGVRWKASGTSGYVPYARIRDASIHPSLVGRTTLVLYTYQGAVRLAIGDTRPGDLFGAILRRIALRAKVEAVPGEWSVLERRNRDLAAWLSDVRGFVASPASAYRARTLDVATLERLFLDERNDVEIRAAAAHALLAGTDEAIAERTALAIGPGAPPLVVAAAVLAAPARIERALVDEVKPFLAEPDRALLTAAPYVRVAEGVRVAVAEADADLADAEGSRDEEPAASKAGRAFSDR